MEEKNVPSPEELNAEQEALVEAKEDEVRTKVVEDFGFDAIEDSDKIEKIVATEMKHRKDLSSAIGQKIKYRDLAKVKPVVAVIPPKKEEVVQGLKEEDVNKKVVEVLEKRDLDALAYSPEIKASIKKVADITGVSIKQALTDPYIVSQIETYEKNQAAEGNGVSRTHKSSGKQTFSFDNPPDVDVTTPEGKKAWDEWKAEAKKQGF